MVPLYAVFKTWGFYSFVAVILFPPRFIAVRDEIYYFLGTEIKFNQGRKDLKSHFYIISGDIRNDDDKIARDHDDDGEKGLETAAIKRRAIFFNIPRGRL